MKRLKAEDLDDDFEKEVLVLCKLLHPNIVQVRVFSGVN